MSKTYTYLMKSGKYYKIGRSTDPEKRLKSILTGNPDIRLICYGDGVTESELHNIYKKNKYKGEWYILRRKDVEDIISMVNNSYKKVIKYDDFVIDFGKYNGVKLDSLNSSHELKYIRWYVRENKKKNNITCKAFRYHLAKNGVKI